VKPSISIVVATVVLTLGCLVIMLAAGWFLTGVVSGYLKLGIPFPHFLSASGLFVIVLPISCSLLGLVTAVGLMRLRDWARKVAIFLSTVPVLSCALLVLSQPPSIFPPPKSSEQYAILTIGPGLGLLFYEYLLVILIPLSIWWLVLFTRKSVRSQFR